MTAVVWNDLAFTASRQRPATIEAFHSEPFSTMTMVVVRERISWCSVLAWFVYVSHSEGKILDVSSKTTRGRASVVPYSEVPGNILDLARTIGCPTPPPLKQGG